MSLNSEDVRSFTEGNQSLKLSSIIAWLLFGMGPSFTLMDTLYLEMPWFEDTQNEGLQLAALLGLGQAFATPFILGFFILDAHFRFSQGKVAIFVTVLSLVSTFFTAFTWHVEVE